MQESRPYHFAAANELHLWLLPTADVPVEYFPGFYRLLSPAERERNQRYVFEKDRIRDLLTRVFIRKLLANYLSVAPDDLQFETNAHGRPALVWPDRASKLDFNLSHAGEMIACTLVSDGRIGIDLEPIDREVNIQQASHFFSKIELEELALLSGNQQKEHFLRLWTLKEAYIKAQGRGLSIPLDSFAFYDFGAGQMRFWAREDDEKARRHWSFFSLRPLMGYRIAGAWDHAITKKEDTLLRLRQWLPDPPSGFRNISFDIEHQIDF